MAAFLVKIFGVFFQPILNWVWSKVAESIKQWQIRREIRKAIEEENKKAREELEKAQTKEERDHAAKNITDKF